MNMNKILICMLVCLMIFPLVASASCGNNNLGTFKSGQTISLRQTCDTCTYVNVSSITLPNSTLVYLNKAMTKTGIEYDYSYSPSILGDYFYVVRGDKNGVDQSETFCFAVTPTGDNRGYSFFLVMIISSMALFILAYVIDMDWLVFLSGILWIFTGVYSMIYGVGNLADLYTRTIAGVCWAIGVVLVVAGIFNISKSEGNISDDE